jgi:L-seryl-tRNA(Ser) seleniumtransferase
MLDIPLDALRRRARNLGRRLRERGIAARGTTTRGVLGGGTTPDESFPSYGLAIPGNQRLTDDLRAAAPPVIARIEGDRVLFDLRTVWPHQDRVLEGCIAEAWEKHDESEGGDAD